MGKNRGGLWAWLRRKATGQKNEEVHAVGEEDPSNPKGLMQEEKQRETPAYYLDSRSDPPAYHSILVSSGGPASTIAAINTAVCSAAIAVSIADVPLVTSAVAGVIGVIADVIASLPPSDSATTAASLTGEIRRVTRVMANTTIRPRDGILGGTDGIQAFTESTLDVLYAPPLGFRRPVVMALADACRHASDAIFTAPASSAPAIATALDNAFTNVADAVASAPAASTRAVAAAYASHARRIASDVAHSITAIAAPPLYTQVLTGDDYLHAFKLSP